MSFFASASGYSRFTGLMPGAGALAALMLLFGWVAPAPNGTDAPPVHHATFVPTVADRAFDAAMDGEQIYYTRCMSCHQMGGRGVPGTFPPLTNTDWVTGDKGRLIRLLLHGLTGPIEVDGVRYSGVMPPWGDALDDQGIADIATYIRTSFGNEASPITTEEVAAVRAATKRRTKPWTAKELNRPANRGVPSDSTTN
jgi:mono/diheme cytochrome c family protein